MYLPHPCGTRMTSLLSPRCAPQNAKMWPQKRPTAGRRAIQEAVPTKASTTLSTIWRGRRCKRTKARCGVIRPPRHPLTRMASSSGGNRLSSPRDRRGLEIEEYTDGASYTVVGGFLVLFEVEVQSPIRPDPLPPSAGDVSYRKIEEHIGT